MDTDKTPTIEEACDAVRDATDKVQAAVSKVDATPDKPTRDNPPIPCWYWCSELNGHGLYRDGIDETHSITLDEECDIEISGWVPAEMVKYFLDVLEGEGLL